MAIVSNVSWFYHISLIYIDWERVHLGGFNLDDEINEAPPGQAFLSTIGLESYIEWLTKL